MVGVPSGMLAEKVALVVGGGGGHIGTAIATTLAAAGARVAVADIEMERAAAAVAQITGGGGQAVALAGDVRRATDAEMFVAGARRAYGGVDILVNVVGGTSAYARWRKLAEWSEEDWDLISGLNLRYMFLTCRATIRAMLEQGRGGSIVNIASVSGLQSAPNHAAYGAAKAGVMSLTRTLAVEYGPAGIRVNAVAPGSIATSPKIPPSVIRPEGHPNPSDARPRAFTPNPAIALGGRAGQPTDIANAVLFFASELASYVTGQVLLVDGGVSIRWDLGDTPPGGN